MIPGGPMRYSRAGDALTKGFESCYFHAYPDPASPLARALLAAGLWQATLRGEPIPVRFEGMAGDPWTVGYGATGPVIGPGTIWTQQQADADLAAREAHCAAAVNAMVDVALTQDEFDALVDFAYNAGVGALQHSTLLRLLNAKQFRAAAEQFQLWDKAGGHVVAGLLRRRMAEAQEFAGAGA